METESKHFLKSKTQIAAMIGSGLLCYGIYARCTGKPNFELTSEEILAISGVVVNVFIQLDRYHSRSTRKLHFFKKKLS